MAVKVGINGFGRIGRNVVRAALHLSNGRLARVGSSLRVESARMAAKPPTDKAVTDASAPPAIIASASPCRIMRTESPMELALVAQAVAVAEMGPLAP